MQNFEELPLCLYCEHCIRYKIIKSQVNLLIRMSILEDILSAYNTPDFKHKLARILPDDENSLGNIYTELNNFNP